MELATNLLGRARRDRMDKFYALLPDIEAEMRHYKEHFKGKVVFRNCETASPLNTLVPQKHRSQRVK